MASECGDAPAAIENLWVFICQQITVVSQQVMAWGGSRFLGV
jgi:hypothetical protein